MKTITLLLLCLVSLCGFAGNRATDIRTAVERQMRQYPQSTLRDIYKNFFQDRFGPGHLLADTAVASTMLQREMAAMESLSPGIPLGTPLYESTGVDGNFYRVSLSLVNDSVIPFPLFLDAFVRSVRDLPPVAVDQWKGEWRQIEDVVSDMDLPLQGYDRDLQEIDSLLAGGKYVMHHSPAYVKAYQPHYRIISRQIFEKELLPLIENAGLEQWSASEPISDGVFSRMWLKSWKADCPLQRSDLRYLKILHRNTQGAPQMGEMVVNASIADVVLEIFRKLYQADYRIERMELIDNYDADDEKSMRVNNSSAFNFRFMTGSKTRISKHGLGLAIDINTLYNPYVKKKADGSWHIEPSTARPYAFDRDRRDDIPYKIDRDDLLYRLFTEAGFEWGGDWHSLKDYQHFEKRAVSK